MVSDFDNGKKGKKGGPAWAPEFKRATISL